MFHKILVAMDMSAIGKHVFDEALSLAKANGAAVMLLHVLSVEEENSPNVPILTEPNMLRRGVSRSAKSSLANYHYISRTNKYGC